MASYTNPILHATGDDLAVTDYNAVANNTTFLYQKPYALYYNSVSTSVPNGVGTQITLGGTTASGYGFSISSNNAILPLTGVYSVYFGVALTTAGTGNAVFLSFLELNGTQVITGAAQLSYTGDATSTGSGLISGSAGATVGLWVLQDSGSTLASSGNAENTFLHLSFVGSQ